MSLIDEIRTNNCSIHFNIDDGYSIAIDLNKKKPLLWFNISNNWIN